ncbi:hypothetical protein HD806DRAFT_196049 [Xylariaceae sp. AK1471]|nr:hypothetical protein HD806DRAFT_196049 [Xylariaceae sp. AK1471]
MSNSTTFSYAQAAKGQLAAQPATSQPSPTQSQPPSVNGSQNRDANNTNVSTRAPSVAVSTTSNDIDSSRSARSNSVKPDAARFNGSDGNQDDTNTTASVAGSLSSSKLGADQSSVDGTTRNTEFRGRSTNTGSDAAEHYEGKKGRKPKKGKSAEKDSEAGQGPDKEDPPPKVELSEAPIPAVNIWVQRREAHKAKTVDQVSHTVGTGSDPTQLSTDSKPRSSPSELMESNRLPLNGKPVSKRDGEPSRNGTNHGPKRAAPRGARAQEKEIEMNLLANNPVSWPTPQTAAGNLKTQPSAQPEKPEKEDKEDAGTAKPKKWVQLPNFVHSVKFETALPGRGPRGGRVGGSRGGRDVAGGNHNTPNPTDRTQEANAASRTNSGSKRAQIEGPGPREGRKNVTQGEHSKLPKESASENMNAEQPKLNQPEVVNGTAHEQSGPHSSIPSQQPEENVRGSDSHKDVKAQNNRDAPPQSQNGSTHRSGERTRGGGRNRGAFNQSNSNGMSHHAQPPYMTQHHAYQFPPNGSRHMSPYGAGYQMSYQFPGQPGPGQRKPTNGNRRQGSGRVPSMTPMNVPYDTNMYPVPNGGIYPYDSSIQLAQSQVEYYFSVDNCVKDWFLRQHMDSQGFVPISFIASFNRMRELLVDINVLRQACIDSTVVEFVMGNDGVERVRCKEGWEQWVIADKNLRDPSARHEGPSSWQQFTGGYQPPMMSPHYPVEAPQVFSPTSEHSFAHYPNGNYGLPPLNVPTMNGVNGHARPHESQLSADVPAFSPSTASTFNGLKPTSPNGDADTESLVNKQVNGVASPQEQFGSMTNGVVYDQHHTSFDDSRPTNGVSSAHETEGH